MRCHDLLGYAKTYHFDGDCRQETGRFTFILIIIHIESVQNIHVQEIVSFLRFYASYDAFCKCCQREPRLA